MSEHLPPILRYLDSSVNGIMRVDRWRLVPAEVRERLERAALFTSHCTAQAICPQCWRACLVDLEQPVTDSRAVFTALCEEDEVPVSVVRVPREQATVWMPHWAGWTDRLRRACQAYGVTRELITERLWVIGRVRHRQGTGSSPVYLARGIWWPHDQRVYQYLASPERETDAIVLQMAEPSPSLPRTETLPCRLYALEDCLWIDDEGRLIIDIADVIASPISAPSPPSAAESPVKYQLVVHPDALTVESGGKYVKLTGKVFAVFHALCRLHQQSNDTWRPQNRIAEEVYTRDEMPDNVRQAINGRIKTIRDALVEAGCIFPEDRATFIEADNSGRGFRINKRLVAVDIR